MSYWKTKANASRQSLDNYSIQGSGGSEFPEFYELEAGVVLDIILDSKHPIFSNKSEYITSLSPRIGNSAWPEDFSGKIPNPSDIDFTWIGKALIRMESSGKNVDKERLIWACPLESNISEYPLVNEMVVVSNYFDRYFYSKKINYRNLPNHNIDFSKELYLGSGVNTELNSDVPYSGVMSKTAAQKGSENTGVAGRYFWVNRNIRALKRFEGDTIIESRFGQSIRFSSYDDNRKNDKGLKGYDGYSGEKNSAPKNSLTNEQAGGGNPMILIRNRQRPLLASGSLLSLHSSPNPGETRGTVEEKNAGGYLQEDINHDGSSIHITSGQTVSKWVTTCYKKMFGTGEEVSEFNGPSRLKYPKLDGDQIVIQSDRLILSARYNETFHYSKKRYAIVTDSEYTVDAYDQIVMTTHVKTVLNSPVIFLGQYDETGEPALLGQTTVSWLYELCNWMLEHTHWYKHVHKGSKKKPIPEKTQIPVQIQKLIALRDSLDPLLSRRVFLTGGGYAPGADGKKIY